MRSRAYGAAGLARGGAGRPPRRAGACARPCRPLGGPAARRGGAACARRTAGRCPEGGGGACAAPQAAARLAGDLAVEAALGGEREPRRLGAVWACGGGGRAAEDGVARWNAAPGGRGIGARAPGKGGGEAPGCPVGVEARRRGRVAPGRAREVGEAGDGCRGVGQGPVTAEPGCEGSGVDRGRDARAWRSTGAGWACGRGRGQGCAPAGGRAAGGPVGSLPRCRGAARQGPGGQAVGCARSAQTVLPGSSGAVTTPQSIDSRWTMNMP